MYYLSLDVDGAPVWSLAHSDRDESVWLAAGFDLLDYQAQPAYELEIAIGMATAIIVADQDRFANYSPAGSEGVEAVLDFLMTVRTACEERPATIVQIDY